MRRRTRGFSQDLISMRATASESWWIGLNRSQLGQAVTRELTRMRRSKFSRPTLLVVGDEGIWKRAWQ